jgi:hypothetical protein
VFRYELLLHKEDYFDTYQQIKQFLSNKTNLFLVLSLSVSSIISYPFLVPHLSHPSMSYHILIHMISLDFAIFLTTISIISYQKVKNKKLLLTSLSFLSLLVIEIIYLLQASHIIIIFQIPLIEVEFSHLLLLFMLVLFACGVLKTGKK